MGDFSEHVLFGFLTAAVTAYFLKNWIVLDASEVAASAVMVFAGSVLPDIDNRKAYVHRAVKAFTSISLGVIGFVAYRGKLPVKFAFSMAVLLAVYTAFSFKKLRHRGITHTVSFAATVSSAAVIGSVLVLGSSIPGIATGIGLFSHLLMDRELL